MAWDVRIDRHEGMRSSLLSVGLGLKTIKFTDVLVDRDDLTHDPNVRALLHLLKKKRTRTVKGGMKALKLGVEW